MFTVKTLIAVCEPLNPNKRHTQLPNYYIVRIKQYPTHHSYFLDIECAFLDEHDFTIGTMTKTFSEFKEQGRRSNA